MSYNKKDKTDKLIHTLDIEVPKVIEIEKAILGAIILEQPSQAIISELHELLFYTKENQLICRAILGLYRKNSPIDLLTVCSFLKENGHLEEVGGPFYVTSLTNNVSSASNIEIHLKLLQENYLKRFIIHTCTTNIQKVISYGNDVFETFSELQATLDNGLKEIIRYEISNVGSVHADMIVESVNIVEKGIRSGVPTHLKMVDNLTNGWQKSDFIILSARPSMGKTAAAVSMALQPALKDKIPVLIFSLEMSSKQLVGRIQSMLSGVDVSKIIKNQLNKDEINYIDAACQELYNAPIFIDDTPNISLIELKSKSRKMVKEHGVKLIIVDYLQLMRSGLNISVREQEVSEISRGLKGLAKELDIPVIALSQLSRLVESTADKKPMLSHLRESGCLSGDTKIYCPSHKKVYRIKDLLYRNDFSILATDYKTNKVMDAKKCFPTGEKNIYEILLNDGRTIKATSNHKFLTEYGWKELKDLSTSDKLASPLNFGDNEDSILTEEVSLVGHFLANGSAVKGQPIRYTQNILDNDLAEVVINDAKVATNFKVAPRAQDTIRDSGSSKVIFFKPTFHLTHGKTSPLADILRKYNLFDKRAKDKFIPDEFFFLSHKKTYILLKSLFSGDGTAYYGEKRGRKSLVLAYSSCSKELIFGIQFLLQKVGIISSISYLKNEKGHSWYHLSIKGKSNLERYVMNIGFWNKRKNDIMLNGWEKSKNNLAGWTKYSFNEDRTLFFSPIKSITEKGIEEVYDIEVPTLHNFVANGMIVHNSLEQDADMVMFCYRPEYYGIDQYEIGGHNLSADGLFMLIVAKHRNGSLGEIPLKFIGSQTKLTNLDIGYSNNSNTFANSEVNHNFNSVNNTDNNHNVNTENVNNTDSKLGIQNNTGFLNEQDVPF